MFKEVDPHQLTSLLLILLTVITLFITYVTSRKRKVLESEIERKENALESKSVNELVSELQQSFQEIEKKITAGKPVIEQLTGSLQHNTEQLKHIEVGLLPCSGQ